MMMLTPFCAAVNYLHTCTSGQSE